MTFMEQEKDDALKMIIATDAKHLYKHVYIYIIYINIITICYIDNMSE